MKRLTGMLAVALMVCALGLISSVARAETGKPPKTVVDFYLMLPKDTVQSFEYDSTTRKQRLKLLHYLSSFADVPHGYLELHGDCDTSFVVCLFRKANGSYLVASYFGGGEDDEEPELSFFEYRGGRLVKVKPLPVAFNQELIYELPRVGTTIKVTTSEGKRAYWLEWNRIRFVLKKGRNIASAK